MLQLGVELCVPRIRGWDWVYHKIRVVLFTYNTCIKVKGRKAQSPGYGPLLGDEVCLPLQEQDPRLTCLLRDAIWSDVRWRLHGPVTHTDQRPGTKSHPFQSDSDMHRMGLAHAFYICSLCSVFFVR